MIERVARPCGNGESRIVDSSYFQFNIFRSEEASKEKMISIKTRHSVGCLPWLWLFPQRWISLNEEMQKIPRTKIFHFSIKRSFYSQILCYFFLFIFWFANSIRRIQYEDKYIYAFSTCYMLWREILRIPWRRHKFNLRKETSYKTQDAFNLIHFFPHFVEFSASPFRRRMNKYVVIVHVTDILN